MTIALGILASDGIAIGADTQETDGYFKGFALKIHSAMTQTSVHSNLNSAVAVTGAGSSVYLDVIAEEIIRDFHSHQDTNIAAFESHLKECVEEFHSKHVTPRPAHLAREINLIVAVQIENKHALWATDVSTVKRSLGFETTGTGRPYARMAIENRLINLNAETAALLAILGVNQAKEHDEFCGKQTMITFLKDNRVYVVSPRMIEKAENFFERYAGIEQSAFLYALGKESSDDAKRPAKVNRWLRALRKEFSKLASELLGDEP